MPVTVRPFGPNYLKLEEVEVSLDHYWVTSPRAD
jgi:hypothetical protein